MFDLFLQKWKEGQVTPEQIFYAAYERWITWEQAEKILEIPLPSN